MWQARYGTRATPDPEHTPRTTFCDVPLADAPFAVEVHREDVQQAPATGRMALVELSQQVRRALDPCTAEWQDTRSECQMPLAGHTVRLKYLVQYKVQ